MSGRRIDDHSFWAGGRSKGSVFPEGAKVKHESSAEGAGKVMQYEDTTERIKATQESAEGHVRRHQGKLPEYRN